MDVAHLLMSAMIPKDRMGPLFLAQVKAAQSLPHPKSASLEHTELMERQASVGVK
jgi:hypothetical protein